MHTPSTGRLNIAVVQMKHDSTEPNEHRIERMEGLVSSIEGADLIVLPELWLHGGFSYDTWRRDAISLQDSLVARMAALARSRNAWLHAGTYIEKEPGEAGKMWNTALFFDPVGSLHETYRKIHRFGFSGGEPKLLVAGEKPSIVQMHTEKSIAITGLSTCYDLRFPELYRDMSSRGTTLNLIPACWPLTRIQHWQTLGRARAIENQAYVVQCNMTGRDQSIELGGHSQIIDANGTIIAECGLEETVIRATVDFNSLHELRHSFPVSADQRADLWTVSSSHTGLT